MDVQRLLGHPENGHQVGSFQLVREFTQSLIHSLHRIHGREVHRDIAGGGLAQLDQVVDEPLHAVRLPGEHLQIGFGVFLGVWLLQKVHIVDNGGQGGLDIVADVGDQLGPHPLGAHLLLGGHNNHIGQPLPYP